MPACAQTVPLREISEQTLLCPCHTWVEEPVVSGTGAVPTWDLPWSVPGVSRIWALLFPAGLVWGSQVMSGSQCGCSAPLFLHTPWGNLYPKGTGWESSQAFSTFGLVAGSCQTLEVLPGFHFGGTTSTSTAWNVQQSVCHCWPPLGVLPRLCADPRPISPSLCCYPCLSPSAQPCW